MRMKILCKDQSPFEQQRLKELRPLPVAQLQFFIDPLEKMSRPTNCAKIAVPSPDLNRLVRAADQCRGRTHFLVNI